MDNKKALKKFFAEKAIPDQTFTIMHNQKVHFIDLDFLINLIVNHTPAKEQAQIRKMIVMIDFQNGDIVHFLNHLAKSYVLTNY